MPATKRNFLKVVAGSPPETGAGKKLDSRASPSAAEGAIDLSEVDGFTQALRWSKEQLVLGSLSKEFSDSKAALKQVKLELLDMGVDFTHSDDRMVSFFQTPPVGALPPVPQKLRHPPVGTSASRHTSNASALASRHTRQPAHTPVGTPSIASAPCQPAQP